MRVHDITVIADLNRHDPMAPYPGDPVVYDGTDIGVGETALSPQDDWMSHVTSWWTGPWPELHCRMIDSRSTNEAITTQVKCDLLGQMTLETLSVTSSDGKSLTSSSGDDTSTINESIVNAAIQLLIDKQQIAIGLVIVDLLWKAACNAANFEPNWGIVACLIGLDWLLLYTFSITIYEESLRTSDYTPAFRFWVLMLVGLAFALGALTPLLARILGALLTAADMTETLSSWGPGGLIQLLFKLVALVPLFACAIATLYSN
ncbi:MAG: hypothetical protein ACP6IT_05270 [Candidatus Thorarchaeota archaeon]